MSAITSGEERGISRDDRPTVEQWVIDDIHDIAVMDEVERLQATIWGSDPAWTVPSHVLHIVGEYGGILLGAWQGSELVGFVLGFLGRRDAALVHASHMLGILPAYRKHGIGAALKHRQRERALSQGLDLMTWTFDPLESRNAHFNLHKLGATTRTYRTDYYGSMRDSLNQGLPSDRLVIDWRLRGIGPPRNFTAIPHSILVDSAGVPKLATDAARSDGPLSIALPRDVQTMKRDDPEGALRWRLAVREAFNWALARGYEAIDFRDGAYVLVPREENES